MKLLHEKKDYSIDLLNIYNTERITAVEVSGWSVMSDGTIPYIELYINDKRVDAEFARFGRPDANTMIGTDYYAKSGFRILYKQEPCIIQSIIITETTENNKKVIYRLTGAELKKHILHYSFLESVDQFQFDPKSKTAMIMGWAIPLVKGDHISYQVTDGKNNKLKSGLRIIQRNDLVQLKITDEANKNCGFIITAECELKKGNKYYIELKDNDTSVRLCLNDYIQRRQSVLPLIFVQTFGKINRKNVKLAFHIYKNEGIKALVSKAFSPDKPALRYTRWFEAHRVTDSQLKKQKERRFIFEPKISILVPTYNTPEKYLREMIETVRKQSYGNWQLCIADGSNENNQTRKILREYAEKDDRILVTYLDENYGISGNTNKALELADGEYIGLYDHDDFLELNALYEIVNALQSRKYDVVYTDEDKFNDKTKLFEDPNMKPDWSPDLFNSHNYITHFFVTKTTLVKEVGGFRSEYDGAQDYDLMFRCIEKANEIYHLPKVLYHWRMHPGSTAEDPASKMYAYEAGKKAIQGHLKRIGAKGTVKMLQKPFWGLYHVTYDTGDNPLISVIIPNCDHAEVLKTCIDSLYDVNQYQNFEIIIIENNSREQTTFDYYTKIQKDHNNIRVITWNGKIFNYSAINNFGVKFAKGNYYLFLNNDTQCMHKDSLYEMVGTCMQPGIGIVGARLLYADNTFQHAGVVIGFSGYAGHVFNGLDNDNGGFMMRPQINCDYSAVTAACMLVKKQVYEQVNGFDEEFRVACNDVDFCLKARQHNWRVVYNAEAYWHHFESKTRGYENNIDKVRRFDEEVKHFQLKWKDILMNGDPYYNKNFNIEDGPYVLR